MAITTASLRIPSANICLSRAIPMRTVFRRTSALTTPLVKFRKGREAVSFNEHTACFGHHAVRFGRPYGDRACQGGRHFLYIRLADHRERRRRWSAASRATRPALSHRDSNIRPDATLADVLALKEQTGHSTIAVTEDGTAHGKLVGIVTSRDYRVSRMATEREGVDVHDAV